jgi:hypothetical protein
MKKLVFNVKAGSGLPGKSFIHIIDVDVYLRTLLSYLVHTPFFDAYVASKIQRHHRYKDREKTTAPFSIPRSPLLPPTFTKARYKCRLRLSVIC